jgi:uncharacterized RDD family membrane protein YckC
VVSIGHDASLPEGAHADSVVAVFGSATSAGNVSNSVVAVLGDSHVTGPVDDSVVAVLGAVYVNSRVRQDVVAVLGNVELGPEAEIDGDVVVIGGSMTRDPHAIVHGSVDRILGGFGGGLAWTRPWVENCLLYGRPLAFAPGLGWVWGVALGFLVLYALLGLLFPAGLERCVQTWEQHPGESVLTSIAALLLTPLAAFLLLITVIGIPAMPLLLLGLLCMTMFGKAAIFAWLGRRLTPFLGDPRSVGHTLVAILVGGAIALALYCVPVVGFLVYNLLGLLGLGVALYTLLSVSRSRPSARPATVPPSYGPPPQTPPPAGPGAGGAAQATAAQVSAAATSGGATSTAEATASGVAAASGAPRASPAELLAMPRANFWPRMGALLIDAVLVGVVINLTLSYHPHNGMDINLILLATYGAVMWKLKGSTIGGIICNHRIVRLDGRELDWPTVIVRALGCFLSALPVGLGFIWIAVDENRQAWHDKIAGTVVVRVPPGTSQFL